MEEGVDTNGSDTDAAEENQKTVTAEEEDTVLAEETEDEDLETVVDFLGKG